MFYVLKLLFNELKVQDANFNRDPRTSHWPLLGSPWKMWTAVIIYVLFVQKWGPKWMAKRQPFDCKLAMQIYNIVQVILNLYVCCAAFYWSYMQPYFSFSCQEYDITDTRPSLMMLRYPAIVYYITKYLDFFDTLFFVLRKKNNQITFLHVYHHALMVFAVWAYTTLLFGSHFTATGVINSFVHVCMYFYYFIAALKPNIDLAPWKRRLTQLQLVQFVFLFYHFSKPIFNNWCNIDMFWTWIAVTQNAFMIVLFSDFYVRTYLMKKKPKLAQHNKIHQVDVASSKNIGSAKLP